MLAAGNEVGEKACATGVSATQLNPLEVAITAALDDLELFLQTSSD